MRTTGSTLDSSSTIETPSPRPASADYPRVPVRAACERPSWPLTRVHSSRPGSADRKREPELLPMVRPGAVCTQAHDVPARRPSGGPYGHMARTPCELGDASPCGALRRRRICLKAIARAGHILDGLRAKLQRGDSNENYGLFLLSLLTLVVSASYHMGTFRERSDNAEARGVGDA